MANSVDTLGVDTRTRIKKLGAKEKAKRKKCRVRVSLIKKKKSLSEKLFESGCQEAVKSGHGAAKTLEVHAVVNLNGSR